MALSFNNPVFLAIFVAAHVVCIGWIPYFIAVQRKALHRHWIGLAGFVCSPLLPMFVAVLFWALMGRLEEAEGRGFPLDDFQRPPHS